MSTSSGRAHMQQAPGTSTSALGRLWRGRLGDRITQEGELVVCLNARFDVRRLQDLGMLVLRHRRRFRDEFRGEEFKSLCCAQEK